jgi:2-dehydro-3-deoxyphosphooctonate aldolase (KDO 8-P synthase)
VLLTHARVAAGQSAAPFFVVAGPNVLESHEHALKMARQVKLVTDSLGLQLVFKASFDKANRTSAGAFRGPGLVDGLRILDDVRTSTGLDIVTDIHEPWQAEPAACVPACCSYASPC